jgi:hypothetical protein
MRQKFEYKGVALFALVLLAILWVAGGNKSNDSSPDSKTAQNTPKMRQLLAKRLNEDPQLRDSLMTKGYAKIISLDDAKFATAEGDAPTFVMYSDMSNIHDFKDNDPDTTSLLCTWITGMLGRSTLQSFGFKQIVFGDSNHFVTCQVTAQLDR